MLLTKDIQAASRRIRTSKSSNCSMTSSHIDLPVKHQNQIYQNNMSKTMISCYSLKMSITFLSR